MTPKPENGTAIRVKTSGKRLICSGRNARRTRYRYRFDYNRTYSGDVIDDDPAVCLECTKPAERCTGEYHCYLHQKRKRDRLREKSKEKTSRADWLLEKWKPSGIYDIWGESL